MKNKGNTIVKFIIGSVSMVNLIEEIYSIADNNDVIMKGRIKLSNGTGCIIFAHYCDSTLFYKNFFKSSKEILKVNKKVKENLKEIKKLLKECDYKRVWTKGIFSFYGDLRPLAVEAGFGQWDESGIIKNEKYGTNFLISAVFYK